MLQVVHGLKLFGHMSHMHVKTWNVFMFASRQNNYQGIALFFTNEFILNSVTFNYNSLHNITQTKALVYCQYMSLEKDTSLQYNPAPLQCSEFMDFLG